MPINRHAGLCLALFAAAVYAQDASDDAKPSPPAGPATASATDAVQKFEEAVKSWKQLEQQLNKTRADFSEADPSDRAPLQARYGELAGKAYEMLPELRAAAKAAYLAEPNKNVEVIKFLAAIMIDDVGARQPRLRDAFALADVLIENNVPRKYLAAAANAPRLSADGRRAMQEVLLRYDEADADLPRVKLTTTKGDVVIELYEDHAPNTVANFISLIESGFYDGLTFHRVIDGFMAQGGDPEGTGGGGPGYTIRCECYDDFGADAVGGISVSAGTNRHRLHFPGSLSMAHAGRDTGGSQFYITFARTAHLDGKHTVFGRVIEGMSNVDAFARGVAGPGAAAGFKPEKITKAEVLRKRDHEYKPETTPDKKPPTEESDGNDKP